jgi:hypothetical protein
MLLVKSGRKPIFFSDVKAADAFVKKCSQVRIFWEVYIIDDGEVRHLGSSEKLILYVNKNPRAVSKQTMLELNEMGLTFN